MLIPKAYVLPMVDREKRDVLAQALRQLISGQINNLQFDDLDDERLRSDDRAIHEIFYCVWLRYDDFRPHKLRLTEGGRLDFLRSILFLHSDVEFEWPVRNTHIFRHLWPRFFGTVRKTRTEKPEPGEMEVFPFFRRSDYEEALKKPRLLAGVS